ncbi:hypothetical protein HJC23_000712 [Cyclotella cryptica]|uniref:CID domain-containing protein n=1 Tax=Cyclotella cryptica TaxID=29204 RepID=A0ABD3Q9B8_9STRA|eukprot:CCRYP_007394-RA/>CCRYP_007394-RA protein AED:0.02 eAED:0.02 QI:137/1/1/1/0.5/0.33/3/1506/433
MADASALRNTLLQTDNTLPSIQSAARSMMLFYDKPSGVDLAVSEWRSVLQTCQPSQMLPLLYVANEVLQTSKRNRGNKFLEAFSPVLGSSLIYICQRDRSLVEKARRTVKVWGDRRIFSMRFVMDILTGLDSFRGEGGNGAAVASQPALAVVPASSKPTDSPNITSGSNSDEDDDEDDIFGGSSTKLLDVDLKVDGAALSEATKPQSLEFGAGAKRRRSSVSPTINAKSSAKPVAKKPKALSNQTFLEMFESIAKLDETYKSALGVLNSIPPAYLDENGTDIDDLVGDELTEMYKKVCETHRKVRKERRVIYSVAVERKQMEKEAKRYIQWLKNLANVDGEDIEFAEGLEQKLDLLSVCHEEAKALRDIRREEEARKLAEEEAAAIQEAEEQERRRMLEDVKKQAEAKPGMVWNPQLREYQYLHDPTQESWRD